MVTLASSSISVAAQVDPAPAVVTRDLVADYSAAGDGVTDDGAAIIAFRNAENAETGVVRLTVPAGDYLLGTSDGKRVIEGFDNIQVIGAGSATSFKEPLKAASRLNFRQSPLYTVRLETVTAGDATVTVKDVDPARRGDGSTGDPNRSLSELMALFTVGQKVLIACGDTQGFGYPPNPAIFEYRTIEAIGVNTITFDRPVEYSYPSTLPHYWNGTGVNGSNEWTGFEIDQGGPATLYSMDNKWDCSVYFANMEMDLTNSADYASFGARLVVWDNVTVIGQQAWPGSAKNIILRNCSLPTMEFDKLCENIAFYNVDGGQAIIQSANPNDLLWIGGTVGNGTTSFNGTPRRSVLKNLTLDGLVRIGPTAYGVCESALLEDCTLLVDDVSGQFRTYDFADDNAVLSGNTITGDSTWGREWALPGTKIFLTIAGANAACHATVVSLTESGANNVVTLDVTPPTYSAGPYDGVIVHACPDFTMRNCTGGYDATQYSAAPDNTPMNSYMRFWQEGGAVRGGGFRPYGRVVSYTVNVTKAYTGVQSSLSLFPGNFGIFGLVLPGGAIASPRFSPGVNLKITGERVFTPSGTTGAQTGDGTFSGEMWLYGQATPLMGATHGSGIDISGEDPSVWPEFVAELVVDPFYQP